MSTVQPLRRRDFLRASGAAAFGLATARLERARADQPKPGPIKVGQIAPAHDLAVQELVLRASGMAVDR